MRKVVLLVLLTIFCCVTVNGSEKVVYVKHYNKYSGPYTDWAKDELWLSNIDGTQAKKLCFGKPSFSRPIYPISRIESPVFSQDNKWIYFRNDFNSHEVYLWRVGVGGNGLKRVTDFVTVDDKKSPYYKIGRMMYAKAKEIRKEVADRSWVIDQSYSVQGQPIYYLTKIDASRSRLLPISSLEDINFSNSNGTTKMKKPDINIFKSEIERVVKLYCMTHTDSVWPDPPDRIFFRSKKIIGDWASIIGCVVDARGKDIGDARACYLLKRTANKWKVVHWSTSESSISHRQIKDLGVPIKIIQELNWFINN